MRQARGQGRYCSLADDQAAKFVLFFRKCLLSAHSGEPPRGCLAHWPFERILLARIERVNIFVVESLFVDLDARAKQ